MPALFTNNASTLLTTSMTTGSLSFSVTASEGALFPSPSGSDYCYITLSDAAGNTEIVKVTSRSTDTFTIDASGRAQDGTSAQAWSIGDYVELCIPAAVLTEFQANKCSTDVNAEDNSFSTNYLTYNYNSASDIDAIRFDPATNTFHFSAATTRDAAGNANIETYNVNFTQLNGVTLTSTTAELNTVDITTPGTAEASKAVICDASRNIINLNNVTSSTFTGNLTGNVTGDVTGNADTATTATTATTAGTITSQGALAILDTVGTTEIDDDSVTEGKLYPWASGSLVIHDKSGTSTTSTSMVKVREVRVWKHGTINVNMGYSIAPAGAGITMYAQIYKNGVAQGTLQNTNSTTTQYYNLDVSVEEGDLIQIYIRTTNLIYAAENDVFQLRVSNPMELIDNL